MAQLERFGRYELLHRVAQGGMGEVFLARLKGPAGFEKLLIIKRILDRYADSPEFVDMFFSEARLAAKLSHRNIVHIFDMGKTEGAYFLAMEHVHGVSLRELISRIRRRGRQAAMTGVVHLAIRSHQPRRHHADAHIAQERLGATRDGVAIHGDVGVEEEQKVSLASAAPVLQEAA